MKYNKIKIGDVFVAFVEDKKIYFRYIADDENCLGGNLIEIYNFESVNSETEKNMEKIFNSGVKFYLLTFIKLGLKHRLWKKIGFSNVELTDIPFLRSSDDYGTGSPKSYKWWIWKPSGERIFIGELKEEYKSYPYAAVKPPLTTIEYFKLGKDHSNYPE
ncbi:MAG: hypothetical protein JXR81_04445 [Candidatus Goldbacteria bacterium]|nr:hypothetical protein [Candidatus Goldiibacteriota bacterium]